MYLHFPDLDPSARGKPEKLQIGYCYMPGLASTHTGAQSPRPNQQQQQGASLSSRGNGVTAADRESEIVRPLRVRNVSDRKLYLTCTPNLRKQCFVYAESPSSSGNDDDNRIPYYSSSSFPATAYVVGGEEGAGGGGGGGGSGWSAVVPNRPQVADLPLLPQSETTLYIGLRPVLPLEALTSG